jgi:hypothetical protein
LGGFRVGWSFFVGAIPGAGDVVNAGLNYVLVIRKTGQKLFEKHLEQYAPTDPLYETYTNAKGKQKRRRRDVPPGLSKRDALILQSVNKRAHYLDKGLSLGGFRVGWSFFVGAIPGAGDVVNAGLNYVLVIRKARQAEIPDWLVRRMLMNMAVAAGIGWVPVAGDIAIAIFKANSRNAALLEEFLRIRGEEFQKLKEERIQNEQQVKPGAGRAPGEQVPGESSTTSTRKKSFWQRNPKKDTQKTETAAITEKPDESATSDRNTKTKA